MVQFGLRAKLTAVASLRGQVSQRKLGSMPLALRALPGTGNSMVLGERLELLSLSPAAARLALRPLDVPPALHATPLRLGDSNGCDSR